MTKGTVGEGGSLRLSRGGNETVAGPGFLVLGYLLSCVRLGLSWGVEVGIGAVLLFTKSYLPF